MILKLNKNTLINTSEQNIDRIWNKNTADTPDDNFSGNVLDPKWTLESGSLGTVDLMSTSNVELLDLNTRRNQMLMQVGRNGSQEVIIRQDYTLPDNSSIILAFSPSLNNDTGIINNELSIGLHIGDGADIDSGNWQYISIDAQSSGWRILHVEENLSNLGNADEQNLGQLIFFRMSRSGLEYRAWYSYGGSWVSLGANTTPSAYDKIRLFTRNLASFGGVTPIQCFHWVRLGGNGIDPW